MNTFEKSTPIRIDTKLLQLITDNIKGSKEYANANEFLESAGREKLVKFLEVKKK